MSLNFKFLQGLLSSISERMRTLTQDGDAVAGNPSRLEDLLAECDALLRPGGDASHLLAAGELLGHYRALNPDDRPAFFQALSDRYGADPDSIHRAYAAFDASGDTLDAQRLFEACEPRRQELLRRVNRHPGATHRIVEMRANLLDLLEAHPSLKSVDGDFVHLLASWFNRGFLMLQRIDWNTPAAILEKVIRYESVHEIHDWTELRKRLDPEDRRCYAFFHPAIGDEPLIFVEIALCQGVPDRIEAILSDAEPIDAAGADTAVFYSISNCQRGLAGITFGNFLIKQVAHDLVDELPNLRRFVTLSPLPGFSRWLSGMRLQGRVDISDAEMSYLESGDWNEPSTLGTRLATRLRQLAAHYLLHAKDASGRPADPVARFHLGNGASLFRINWPGDASAKGRAASLGLMVNYAYDLNRVEANHEAFTRDGNIVCANSVRQLAARARPLIVCNPGSPAGPSPMTASRPMP